MDFDEKLLYLHYDENFRTLRCFYDGEPIKTWYPRKYGQASGSRYFFSIFDKWFVKAQAGYEYCQTWTEVRKRKMIASEDDHYFVKLLAHNVNANNKKESILWSAWEYIDLMPFLGTSIEDNLLADQCQFIVDKLCGKYSICDVGTFINGNWFVHNGQPLIVDLGCE